MVKILKKKIRSKISVKKPIKKSLTKKKVVKVKQKVKVKTKVRTKTKVKVRTARTEEKNNKLPIKLERYDFNPIISPRPYSWESKATFNPTAVEIDGTTHIIYRAIGGNDSSVLGYATSTDGFIIKQRPTHLIYRQFIEPLQFETMLNYSSGGGWNGGCEDPRLTKIGDTIYMLYTSFNGWGSVRIALTSIPVSDFKQNKWNWKKPVLISPVGEINKNWVIFPEKINNKFAILHSISPKILIDYIDDLNEFNEKKFIHSISHQERENDVYKTGIRGVGPSPIKTRIGWLVLYHATETRDPGKYKIWAMILDYKNPTKVLYRSTHPILEPDMHYENQGIKSGIVYSCGAIVKNGELFVYYGGADTIVGVATISLEDLLESLQKEKEIKLRNK